MTPVAFSHMERATAAPEDIAAMMRWFLERDCSLAEVLVERATTTPNATAYVFIDRDEDCSLSYGAIYARASAFAAELVARGVAGQPVANLLPTSPAWVFAFFGAMLAEITVTVH